MAELFDLDGIERNYSRCVTALKSSGILIRLPESENPGVIGIDSEKYPIPRLEQVAELFERNRELVGRKVQQGFDRLELTPMAMPIAHLTDRLKTAILKHTTEGRIFQTRRFASDPLLPVRVNKEKQVWAWNTLLSVINANDIVYFPKDYSSDHQGLTKAEVVYNNQICAFPGWSVALAESLSIMAQHEHGKILGGRRQLETGLSPKEYLHLLPTPAYYGETGNTLEDFITRFIVRLGTLNEVSNDRSDNNALWCLGQYAEIKYAEVVPTAYWIRDLGRVRLDMHRTGNKLCTRSWGGSTLVRLPGNGYQL